LAASRENRPTPHKSPLWKAFLTLLGSNRGYVEINLPVAAQTVTAEKSGLEWQIWGKTSHSIAAASKTALARKRKFPHAASAFTAKFAAIAV
jgi:hypothetical protein